VRLECDVCHTAIEGAFDAGRLSRLSREQIAFVEVFLECRGKIKDVEERLGLSYPTVISRLEYVIAALGAPVPVAPVEAQETQTVDAVLAALAKNEITPAEAAKRIKQARKP